MNPSAADAGARTRGCRLRPEELFFLLLFFF